MAMMKKIVFILTVLVFSINAFALVTTQVESTQVNRGESFRLLFSYEGQARGIVPDFSPLEKYFEILGTSRSSQVSIINGKVTSNTQWIVSLVARKSGTITIPSLQFGNDKSESVKIQVTKQDPIKSGKDIFLSTSVDTKTPYVQSQVIYKVKLYYSKPLSSGDFKEPSAKNAMLMRLGKSKSYQETNNGRLYQILEQDYAVFPQKSGKITIESPIFKGAVRVSGTNRIGYLLSDLQQPISVTADDIELDVKAVPSSFDSQDWLPAKNVKLTDEWGDLEKKNKIGVPITRTISFEATGLTAEQLPELKFSNTDKLNVYPEKPENKNSVVSNGVTGIKTIKVVYIPSKGGNITIPELSIKWFDTINNKTQVAKISEQSFSVVGEVAESNTANQKADQIEPKKENRQESSSNTPWLIALFFGLAWGLTLIYYKFKKGNEHDSPEKNKYDYKKELKKACLNHDPKQAQHALLQWAKNQWPDKTIYNLSDLAMLVRDKAFKHEINQLQECLYQANQKKWTGNRLWECVTKLKNKTRPKKKTTNPLPPMNPVN